MKRILIAILMLTAFAGAKAQNCEAIVLPFFNGDRARLANYPAEKLQWRCSYARNAFYVSDTVPEWAEMGSLQQVKNKATGEYLDDNFVVDLENLSYYAYNFEELQYRLNDLDGIICFPTPKSEHPYLVLRSLNETYFRTEFPENYTK